MAIIRTEQLTLGEKIRLVRKLQMSLAELAVEINCDESKISRLENGKTKNECDPETLTAIRKALKIEGMPLSESEREGFDKRMRKWCILIDDGKYREANEVENEFSAITKLPFEQDFIALYRVLKARLLHADNNIKAVKKLLAEVEPSLENASERVIYHYSHVKGHVDYAEGKFDIAFYSYLKAYKTRAHAYADNPWLYYCLAASARRMGWASQIITFAEKAQKKYKNNNPPNFELYISNALVAGYVGLNLLAKAEELLDSCLATAQKQNDKLYISGTYINYSYLNCIQKDWHAAIINSNKALKLVEQGTQSHFETIYQQARALIGLGDMRSAETLLKEAKKLANDDENYLTQYKALECLMTIKDKKSIDYLTDEAIPYFEKTHQEGMMILDFCDQIMEQCKNPKIGTQERMLNVLNAMVKVYKNLRAGGELT